VATKLYLRSTDTPKFGFGGRFDALTTAGPSLTTAIVNTAASGTDIQWTKTAGGQQLEWISPPFAADVTILTTDTITFNLWGLESNLSANCGARVHLYRWSSVDGSLTELAGSPWSKGVEFTTSAAVQNWTGTVSSNQTFFTNDRLVIRCAITNVGTMATGFTCTMDYDGPTNAADGDSWVQLNNTVTFGTEDLPGVLLRYDPPPSSGFGPAPGHSLAPRHAWFFGDNTSGTTNSKVYDRFGNRHGLVTRNNSGAVPRSMIRVANGLRYRVGGDFVNFGDSRLIIPTNGLMTIVLAARFTLNDNTVGDLPAFNIGSFTAAETCELDTVAGTTNQLAFKVGGNGEGSTKLTVSSLNINGDSVYAVTTGPRGMEMWQDGIKVGSNAGTPTVTASANNFGAGDASGNQRSALVTIGYLAVYRRQLTPEECKRVTRGPF
jgi:hypothetical protein